MNNNSYYYRPASSNSPLNRTPDSFQSSPEKPRNPFWEIFRFTLISLVIVLPIRLFIIQPFIVSGDSMLPNLVNNEYLIVDQISYKFGDIKRGDVVVFQFPKDPSRFFVKRIIGLPGERILLDNNTATIFNDQNPEGTLLDEPYVKDEVLKFHDRTLDNDEYFVMGDNRLASSDSRKWGPVEEKFITGRALIRLFPPGKAAIHPADYRDHFLSDES